MSTGADAVLSMRTKSTTLSLVVILSSIGTSAPANGTTIIIGYSKDKIVVAADSRSTEEDGGYTDNACKVVALNDKFLFSISGRFIDVTGGRTGWNAVEQAETAFSQISKLPLEFTFTGDVADLWIQLIGRNVDAHIRRTERERLKPNQIFVDGMFFGFSPGGRIQVARAEVRRSLVSSDFFSPPIEEMEVPDTMNFIQQGGESALFNEFSNDTTARATSERATTNKLAKKWRPEEVDARMAMRMVGLIIQYASDHSVGGPVDAVELKKGGTVHWIQRKPNCQDHP